MRTSAATSFSLLLLALALYACAPAVRAGPPTLSPYAVASWYGPGFHGKLTASGEVFDMYRHTAAHRSLPFGTRLRVTNLSNGRSTVVVINDRGPFVPGRDIDLSWAAARDIGMLRAGTARVRLQHLGRDLRYVKRIKYGSTREGPFTIQVGSFREADNARRLKESLSLRYRGVYILKGYLKDKVFYRVRVGRFTDQKRLLQVAQALASEGYPVLITSWKEAF